ncbi:MAG: single-stranded DNA-binding protein [Planctomycetota bacterium]|jgi:single-strand DNA-binding protein
MASFNRVILVGNLTRDVDLKYTAGNTAVTELGLAVNDRVKKNNEWVDETTFVDVTLWGRTAEVASEYLSKGSSVLIEGRLKLDTWEKDGQKRSKLHVIGERMQMLGGRGAGAGGSGGGSGGSARSSNSSGERYSGSSAPEMPASHGGSNGGDDVPF